MRALALLAAAWLVGGVLLSHATGISVARAPNAVLAYCADGIRGVCHAR